MNESEARLRSENIWEIGLGRSLWLLAGSALEFLQTLGKHFE